MPGGIRLLVGLGVLEDGCLIVMHWSFGPVGSSRRASGGFFRGSDQRIAACVRTLWAI